MGNFIYLLSDGADGNDSFHGSRGIVKAYNQVIIRQGSVFTNQQV